MKMTYWFAILSILLLGACDKAFSSSKSNLDQTITPTTKPSISVTSLVANQPLSYQGITPGVSHKNEILAKKGEPNVIRSYGEYESMHYFPDYGIKELFLVKNDIVQAVTSNNRQNWLIHNNHLATVDDLFQVLGYSEVITPTFGNSTYIFPQYGLAVSEDTPPRSPYQFFAPMNLNDYQAVWGEYPLGHDPFPLIPGVEAAGIKPGQTTRDQVRELLDNPDRIVFENRNDPWLYFAEPDTLGQLFIFFDTNNVVKNIDITPGYRLVLEDVVNLYGEPDVLQLIPNSEGINETLAILYFDRGLRFATKCITLKCETVRRNAWIHQKWYFPPTTLEEYQTEFPDPNTTYLEWHGFDE